MPRNIAALSVVLVAYPGRKGSCPGRPRSLCFRRAARGRAGDRWPTVNDPGSRRPSKGAWVLWWCS